MREEEEEIFRIGILEPSAIVTDGLSNILLKLGNLELYHIDYVADLEHYIAEDNLQLIIINPQLILLDTKEFMHIKRRKPNVTWCALVYSFFAREVIEMFDMQIQITDSQEYILNLIRSKLLNENNDESNSTEQLSDRELDVLRLLVQGKMNKEIADILNISVHTVISHRKNITQKTGIKTQAGLTIYALSNRIINI